MRRIFSVILIGLAIYGGINHYLSRGDQTERAPEEVSPKSLEPNEPKEKPPQEPIKKKTPPSLQKTVLPSQRVNKKVNTSSPKPRGRHDAFVDEEGSLYPTKLLVDEEHVIAYGDVIVGEARFIDDYQSGDKEIKIETPEPWPKGILPYRFKDITSEQEEEVKKIARELKARLNIQLIPYESSKHKAWVTFKAGGQHCYSQVGFRLGESFISLNPSCGFKEIYHELFHALGFFHEQNRFDRDEYIQVIWENINEEHWGQFERFSKNSFPEPLRNTRFSFDTFMLYPSNSFSNSLDYSLVTIDGSPYLAHDLPTDLDFSRLKSLYSQEISP